MSGRKQPPSCRVCKQPMWRSKHGFGLCPDAKPIEGGPQFMRLVVSGWTDTTVRVARRTAKRITVVFEDGATLDVEASGVLFPIAEAGAA